MTTERNRFVEAKPTTQNVNLSSVDTDANGIFNVEFDDLRSIDDLGDVIAQAESGYMVTPQGISGNSVDFALFQSASGNQAEPLSGVSATNNVTPVNIRAWGQ